MHEKLANSCSIFYKNRVERLIVKILLWLPEANHACYGIPQIAYSFAVQGRDGEDLGIVFEVQILAYLIKPVPYLLGRQFVALGENAEIGHGCLIAEFDHGNIFGGRIPSYVHEQQRKRNVAA